MRLVHTRIIHHKVFVCLVFKTVLSVMMGNHAIDVFLGTMSVIILVRFVELGVWIVIKMGIVKFVAIYTL